MIIKDIKVTLFSIRNLKNFMKVTTKNIRRKNMKINAKYKISSNEFLSLLNKKEFSSIELLLKTIMEIICKDEISCIKDEIIEQAKKSNQIEIQIKTIKEISKENFLIEDIVKYIIVSYIINENLNLENVYKHMGYLEKNILDEIDICVSLLTDNLMAKDEMLFILIKFK